MIFISVRNRLLLWFLLISLLLSACAGMQSVQRRPLEGIQLYQELNPDVPIGKAIYNPFASCVYVLNTKARQVNIYQGEKLLNTIGGSGFERSSIQRLTDIGISDDGTLLVLDSMGRSVKRFSSDGAYISEIALDWLAQPELLCQSPDQTLYVYDSSGGEIICISALDQKEQFRFGKFQLAMLSSLSCSRDYVVAYSSATGKSLIYSSLGQLIRSVDGYWITDNYRNAVKLSAMGAGSYTMTSRIPESPEDWPELSGTEPLSMVLQGGYLCVAEPDKLIIYRLNYQVAP